MTKPHNIEKDAHETAIILSFLPFLAKYGGKDYAFLSRYLAEAEQEIEYILQKHGKRCHNLADLNLGQGEIPVLYKNTTQNESKNINYGCDFVLNLREGGIQTIAKKYNLAEKEINLCSWLQIYFEITECVDPTEREVLRNPVYKNQLPSHPYPSPKPRSANLTNAQAKKEPDRYIQEANDLMGTGICGDRGEKQWAEKAISDIKNKIAKYKKKEAALAAVWVADQKKQFPAVLKTWEEQNTAFKKAQQKNGAISCFLYAKPSCPTEKDWPGYAPDYLREIWLLINSEYWMEFISPLDKLAPYLIWQAGKEKLEDFLPFRRMIIMTSQGCLVFKNDFRNYEIWPQNGKLNFVL